MRRPSSGVGENSEGELLRAAVQQEAARSAVGQMATPAVDRTQVQSESGDADGSAAAAAAPPPDVHVDVPAAAPAGEATPGAPPALTGRRRVSLRV